MCRSDAKVLTFLIVIWNLFLCLFWNFFSYEKLLSLLDGDRDRYQIEGLMESPAVDDDGDCFSPLILNATSINVEVYYNKAVNYTLMVTFVSFIFYFPSVLHLVSNGDFPLLWRNSLTYFLRSPSYKFFS